MKRDDGLPDWVKKGTRLDRPTIHEWYRPEEHGDLEGNLLWQGDLRSETGPFHVFAVLSARDAKVYGVRERAGLTGLRRARSGKVLVRPKGKKAIGDDREMWEFEVYAEEVEPSRGEEAPF
jgi:hypothetical protein